MTEPVARFEVRGMTCDHCTRAVSKALAAVPGVTRVVAVDLARGEATLLGSPSGEDVVAALEREGYEARRLT